jgi:FHS family L-fucose permease-like MFS transporter
MAIVGGAIMPLVQGATLDATSPAVSFVVPAVCFAVVAVFAFYDLRTREQPVIATSKAGAA